MAPAADQLWSDPAQPSFPYMEDFTPTDVHAAHVAMIDMEEAARKYREKKPGSSVAESFARKAAGPQGSPQQDPRSEPHQRNSC